MNLIEEILNNSGLLLEATVDEIYNKFYKNIDRKKFDSLLNADPTYKGGSKKGKFLDWIVKHAPNEDVEIIKAVIFKFNKNNKIFNAELKKEIKFESDISKFKNLEDLEKNNELVEKADKRVTDNFETKASSKKNTILVVENEKFKVFVPLTKHSSIRLYSRLIKQSGLPSEEGITRWCTATKGLKNAFASYTQGDNKLVIFESKKVLKGEESAYQFADYNNEFKNLVNKPAGISYDDFLKKNFSSIEIKKLKGKLNDLPLPYEDKKNPEKTKMKGEIESEFKKIAGVSLTYKLVPKNEDSKIYKNGYSFVARGYVFKDVKIGKVGMDYLNNNNKVNYITFKRCDFENEKTPVTKNPTLEGELDECTFNKGSFKGGFHRGTFKDGNFLGGELKFSKWYKGYFEKGDTLSNEIFNWKTNKYVFTHETPAEYEFSYQNYVLKGDTPKIAKIKKEFGIQDLSIKHKNKNKDYSISTKETKSKYGFKENMKVIIKNCIVTSKSKLTNFSFERCDIEDVKMISKSEISECRVKNSNFESCYIKNVTDEESKFATSKIKNLQGLRSEFIEGNIVNGSILRYCGTPNNSSKTNFFKDCSIYLGEYTNSDFNECKLDHGVTTTDSSITSSVWVKGTYVISNPNQKRKFENNKIFNKKTKKNESTSETPAEYKFSSQNYGNEDLKDVITNLI